MIIIDLSFWHSVRLSLREKGKRTLSLFHSLDISPSCILDIKIEKKNNTWKKVILAALALIAIVWVSISLYMSAGTSKLNVQQSRILTDTVRQAIFQEYIPVTGVVQPYKTVVIAAVEGGRIDEKLVEDGTTVTAGTPIIRLSNSDLQLNYLNQEANIIAQINQIRNMNLLQEQQSLNLKETALDAGVPTRNFRPKSGAPKRTLCRQCDFKSRI